MAQTPRFKVYTAQGEYVAACKYAEDAAAVVAAYGDGTTIRFGHRTVVFTQGSDDADAGDSYDDVAALVNVRAMGLR